MENEPEIKRPKIDTIIVPENAENIKKCKHFVKRKNRFCKMAVGKNKEYCGEHEPHCNIESESNGRIPCPLDSKHSIYKKNLQKHLKICNARPKTNLPNYICPQINSGSDNDDIEDSSLLNLKLKDLSDDYILGLVEIIEEIFNEYIDGKIKESIFQHDDLLSELSNKQYGKETRKHLIQTSSIMGNLEDLKVLDKKGCFIEFGAGKGQVSYWLARNLIRNKIKSKVVLVDRASVRHKKDNKIEDHNIVVRIRADIADFKMENLNEISDFKDIVAVSKHLCGAATDLTLRCILNNYHINDAKPKCKAFLIAVCCHHRCDWKSFVGKQFLKEHNLNKKDFVIMTKMAGWAICGDGLSRECRKEFERNNSKPPLKLADMNNLFDRETKVGIGMMVKRILDYARLCYIIENNFECRLRYYVKSNVTLENACLIGRS